MKRNKFTRVLSLVLSLVMTFGMNLPTMTVQAAEACDHVYDYEHPVTTWVAPKCTTEGYGQVKCTKCQAVVSATLPALGHQTLEQAGVEATSDPATCQHGSREKYTCGRKVDSWTCNEEVYINEKDDMIPHDFSEQPKDVVIQEKDCQHVEIKAAACKYGCGTTDPDEKNWVKGEEKGDHVYEGAELQSLLPYGYANPCGYADIKGKLCVLCNDIESVKEDSIVYEGADQAVHANLDDADEIPIPATCTEGSYIAAVCPDCGQTVKKKDVDVDARDPENHAGHELTDFEQYAPADCNSVGKVAKKCTGCGEFVESTVKDDPKGKKDPTNHSPYPTEPIPAVPATCTTTGKTAGTRCTGCKAEIVKPTDTPVDLVNGHKWDDGTIKGSNNCKDPYSVEYTCENGCGQTKTEQFEKGHHFKDTNDITKADNYNDYLEAIKKDCTVTFTLKYYCTNTAEEKRDGEHDSDPTNGTCELAEGRVITKVVEGGTHTYNPEDKDHGWKYEAANCAHGSRKVLVCTKCGKEETTADGKINWVPTVEGDPNHHVGDLVAHTWQDSEDPKKEGATCTKAATKEQTCTVCKITRRVDDTSVNDGKPLGHETEKVTGDYDGTQYQEPDCMNDGYYYVICTRDGCDGIKETLQLSAENDETTGKKEFEKKPVADKTDVETTESDGQKNVTGHVVEVPTPEGEALPGKATGHKNQERQNDKPVKCNDPEGGETGDLVCTDCQYVIEKSVHIPYVEGENHKPVMEEYVKTDCSKKQNGFYREACEYCHKVYRYVTVPYEHDFDLENGNATITAGEENVTCQHGGEVTVQCGNNSENGCTETTKVTLPAKDHEKGVEFKEDPRYSYDASKPCVDSVKIYKCRWYNNDDPNEGCHETFVEEVPATKNHSKAAYEIVAKSCTTDGVVKATCSVCGTPLPEKDIPIPIQDMENDSAGTQFTSACEAVADKLIELEPDTYQIGNKEQITNDLKAASGKATGHSYDVNPKDFDKLVVKADSCTEDGAWIMKCKNCDQTTGEEQPIAKPEGGHHYVDVADTYDPATDEHAGLIDRKCDNKHYKVGDVIGTNDPAECGDLLKDQEMENDPKWEDHKWVVDQVYKAAGDCLTKTNGLGTEKCAGCGEVRNVVIPWEHDTYEDVIQQGSCIQDKIVTVKCRNQDKGCGFEVGDPEVTTAPGHKFVKKTIVKATCSTEGLEGYVCTVCETRASQEDPQYVPEQYRTDTVVPANNEHSYQWGVLKANCAHAQSVAHICTACGAVDPDEDVTAITGSNADDLKLKIGKGNGWVDASAQDVLADQDPNHTAVYDLVTEVADMNDAGDEHVYEKTPQGKFIPANCTEAARFEYTCDKCGEVLKVPAAEADPEHAKDYMPKGHSWTNVEAKAPKCNAPGYTAHRECSVCNTKDEDYAEIPATPNTHNWDWEKAQVESNELGKPACEVGGKLVATCADCKTATTSKPIAAGEHSLKEGTLMVDSANGGKKVVDAAGDIAGVGFYCEYCKEIMEVDFFMPGTDWGFCETHGFIKKTENDVVDQAKEATCSKPGNTASYKCSKCAAAAPDADPVILQGWEKKTIEPLGFVDGNVVTVQPNCGKAGTKTTHCKYEGVKDSGCTHEPKVESFGEPTGKHNFNDHKGTFHQATCKDDAYVDYVCTVCGAPDPDMSPNNHYVYEGSHNDVPHTWVFKNGQITCDVCGTTENVPDNVKYCTKCKKLITDAVVVPGTPAECEKPGTEDGWQCPTCKTVTPGKETPALQHDVEYKVTDPGDCQNYGKEEGDCKNCGKHFERALTEYGPHNYEISMEEGDYEIPSCTKPGYFMHKCTVCGEGDPAYEGADGTVGKEDVDPMPHRFDSKGVCEECSQAAVDVTTSAEAADGKVTFTGAFDTIFNAAAEGNDVQIVEVGLLYASASAFANVTDDKDLDLSVTVGADGTVSIAQPEQNGGKVKMMSRKAGVASADFDGDFSHYDNSVSYFLNAASAPTRKLHARAYVVAKIGTKYYVFYGDAIHASLNDLTAE